MPITVRICDKNLGVPADREWDGMVESLPHIAVSPIKQNDLIEATHPAHIPLQIAEAGCGPP